MQNGSPEEVPDSDAEAFAKPDQCDQRNVELASLDHLNVLEVDPRVFRGLIQRPASRLPQSAQL